jgi:protein SCO1/2
MSETDITGRTGARWFIVIAVAVASIALVIVAFFGSQYYFGAFGPNERADSAAPAIGGPFTLTDQHGNTVTDADFRGRYMLVYFGFTYCPDVCPTTLATMTEALDQLGDAADDIVPVLITVDPERDTPEQLKMYVSHFSPRIVALTGTPEQIADVAREYRIYYAKAAGEGDAYTMDHSSITYLMGPDGAYVRHFSHVTGADRMAEQLRAIVAPAAAS